MLARLEVSNYLSSTQQQMRSNVVAKVADSCSDIHRSRKQSSRRGVFDRPGSTASEVCQAHIFLHDQDAVYKHVSCYRCDLVIAATCSGCLGPFDLDLARLVPHKVLSLSWLCK